MTSFKNAGAVKLDQKGSSLVMFITLVSFLALFVLGFLAIEYRWTQVVALQRNLDVCVGETALQFETVLNLTEGINVAIRYLRVVITLTQYYPPVSEGLKALTQGLQVVQKILETVWTLKRIAWISMRGCGNLGKFFALNRLAGEPPEFPWTEQSSDSAGVQPLKWNKDEDEDFKFWVFVAPREGGAVVKLSKYSVQAEGYVARQWHVRWKQTIPPSILRVQSTGILQRLFK